MPDREQFESDIRNIIIQLTGKDPGEFNPESDYISLGLDSLSWLEFLAEYEKKYSIRIPDSELIRLTRLDQLKDYLDKQLSVIG